MIWLAYDGKRWEALFEVYEVKGVRVSLGLIFLIQPSSLGFIALRIPFHWDPYSWAPPARGDPYPQLHHHCFLRLIAVGIPPHPALWIVCEPLLGLYPHQYCGAPHRNITTTLINFYETQNSFLRLPLKVSRSSAVLSRARRPLYIQPPCPPLAPREPLDPS